MASLNSVKINSKKRKHVVHILEIKLAIFDFLKARSTQEYRIGHLVVGHLKRQRKQYDYEQKCLEKWVQGMHPLLRMTIIRLEKLNISDQWHLIQ